MLGRCCQSASRALGGASGLSTSLVPLCSLRAASFAASVSFSPARSSSTSSADVLEESHHIGGYNFPDDLRPTRLEENGGWRSPRVSAMKAAKIRKQGILAMAAGAVPEGTAALHGSDAVWRPLKVPKARHARPPKGRPYDLNINTRLDKIAEGLKAQEKKQADYKKTLPPKPISEGLLQYVKKNAWER